MIRRWHKQWDGSVESLRKSSGGDRRSIFIRKEKKVYIKNFVDKRAKSDPVGYPKTGKVASLTTGKKIGKQLGATSKNIEHVLQSQGKSLFSNPLSMLGTNEYWLPSAENANVFGSRLLYLLMALA